MKSTLSEPNQHVVIVGAGLGGLLCAAILAKEGFKVTIVDKNKQLGGCLQTYALDKKVFDSCVHYIGGLGEGHSLRKIFRYVGILDQLNIKAYPTNHFDAIKFDDDEQVYFLPQGEDKFIEQLIKYFPDESEKIKAFVDKCNWVAQHFPLYYLNYQNDLNKVDVINLTIEEVFQELKLSHKLQAVLCGNSLLYAGNKNTTPFYVLALVLLSYIHSSHKIVPGSSHITKALVSILRQYSVQIYKECEITNVVVDENYNAINIVDSKGNRYFGDKFIWNCHPHLLISYLPEKTLKGAYVKRIQQIPQTTSCILANISLKEKSLKYPGHNTYWFKTSHVILNTDSQTKGDISQLAIYPNEDSKNEGWLTGLSVLCYSDYNEWEAWFDTINTTSTPDKRPPSYMNKKESLIKRLMTLLHQKFQIELENIKSIDLASPLTFRDYLGTTYGSLYGNSKEANAPMSNNLSVKTRLPNLYLTGQNIGLHGILGVSLTALTTCGEIIDLEQLLEKIKSS